MKHAVQRAHVLRRMLNALGKIIVLVLHGINSASCHADQIVLLKAGKTVRPGTTDQIIDVDALRAIYETEIPIEVINGNRIGVYFA